MSRRRRTAIFTLCLLLVALLIWLDHSPVRRKWHPQPNDVERYHAKTFTVVNVVDGDTIDIDIADGKYKHTRIRLWGIDTPETKSGKFGVRQLGLQAADFTKKLALGEQVTVYLDKGNRTRGKYRRLLAYVQLSDGRFLNKVLVAEGFAYADLRFPHSFYHEYRQLQASAHRQKKGLWPKVTRELLPEWLQQKRPNLLKKR